MQLNIDLATVKSFVVRRTSVYDRFTVVMKPNHTCTDGDVSKWCTSLLAHHVGSDNQTFCSCTCHFPTYSFLASMQRCVKTKQAEDFGGKCTKGKNCKSYVGDDRSDGNQCEPIEVSNR